MTDTVRMWLVERSYDDRNLITLVYSTLEGDRMLQKEQAATVMHQQGQTVTAAIDVDSEGVESVPDEETAERYATEAERMAESYDPDEEV